MFRRVVKIAGRIATVVLTTAFALTVSAHTSTSERSFERVKSYSEMLTARMFESIAPLGVLLDRWQDWRLEYPTTPVSSGNDYNIDAPPQLLPPVITRVAIDSDGSARLRGTGTPGVAVALYDGRLKLAEASVTGNGQWSVMLEPRAGYGSHRVTPVAVHVATDHRLPGDAVWLALPQSITAPKSEKKSVQAVSEGKVLLAQRDDTQDQEVGEDQTDDQSAAELGGFTATVLDWLRRSSTAYDAVIVRDLAGDQRALDYVERGGEINNNEFDRDARDSDVRGQSSPRIQAVDDETFTGRLRLGWQNFSLGISEWLRQAQESYQANVVEKLETGERVSRDRFTRADPERIGSGQSIRPRIPVPPQEDLPAPRDDIGNFDDTQDIDRSDAEPFDPDTSQPDWPVVAGNSGDDNDEEPALASEGDTDQFDWPVIEDRAASTQIEDAMPELPEVAPDPEKEALIRKAEQDAEAARERARRAAELAERTRKETEALIAEEKRLREEAEARAKQRRADDDAERKRLAEEARRRLEQARAEAKARAAAEAAAARQAAELAAEEAKRQADLDAERRASEAKAAAEKRQAEEQRQAAERARDDAERQAAEALAAAANEEADKQFAERDLDRPPVSASATTPERSDPENKFTVAEVEDRPVSLKDNPADALVEEGSTLGDIDDDHPSVRKYYDNEFKAKKRGYKKKRSYKKRAYKKRRYAKKRGRVRSYRRSSRKAHHRSYQRRSGYKRRAYRSRRAVRSQRYRRSRAHVHRFARRVARHVRSFGYVKRAKRRHRSRSVWRCW